MHRLLIALVFCCSSVGSSQATTVVGYFEGRFVGVLNFGPPPNAPPYGGGDISSDHARLYFAYNSSNIPDAPQNENCPAFRCTYSSGGGVSWLSIWFDFGVFKGSSIQGSEVEDWLTVVDNDFGFDRLDVALNGRWATSFGDANNALLPVSSFLPLLTFDSTSAVQSTEGVIQGSGFTDRHRMGGQSFKGEGFGWEVEYEARFERFKMWTVSEPPALVLLCLGIAGIAFTRRRKQ